MEDFKIFRKRMIPEECIPLDDDEILEFNEDKIITKWHVLKPRRDFDHGYSCYYPKLGFKVSKFFCPDNSFLYWYCDIIDCHFEDDGKTVIASDLLADVIIYPDGYVKVVDLDELAISLEKGLCEPSLISQALRKLDKLLNLIYDDKFEVLCAPIESYL
jgi:hypothetical protein